MGSLMKKHSHTIIVTIIFVLSALFLLQYENPFRLPIEGTFAQGVHTAVVEEITNQSDSVRPQSGEPIIEQELVVRIDGESYEAFNDFLPVERGQKVVVQGNLDLESPTISVVDIDRSVPIALVAALFVLVVFGVSRWQGIKSLVGLFFSFVVIFTFLVPQILSGRSPVFIGLVSSMIILVVSLYASHGFNKKSFTAFAGIGITLLLIGLITFLVFAGMDFSGFAGDDTFYLSLQSENPINLAGLLLAGILIATIGAMDDVAVTQASIVFNLKETDTKLSPVSLFSKAMSVGRDHISSLINTLVLAYTGAALPLILLLSISPQSFSQIIGGEQVATEIVRTLITTAGLLLAVPFTTVLAVFIAGRTEKSKK